MWCLERLLRGRDRILRSRARRSRARSPAACANVLTPDRIPEFCIPPRMAPRLALAAIRDSWREEAGVEEGASRTDWDPRSQAALSLPHLPRARTAYGFCALLESPHTRRKESLFLGDPAAPRAPRAAPAPTCAPPTGCCAMRFGPGGVAARPAPARSPAGTATATTSAKPPRGPRPRAQPRPRPLAAGRLQPEDAGALHADHRARGGRLRLWLLRPESPAAVSEPRASGRRLRLALRPPGTALDPDSRCDAASGEPGRRLAVQVRAKDARRPRAQGSPLLLP